MRLHELHTIRHLPLKPPSSWRDFVAFKDALIEKGFSPLGTGAFASVFTSHHVDYAIKLFDISDKAYIAFRNYVDKNPGNPHLPVFRGKVKKVSSGCMACRMELLNGMAKHEHTSVSTLFEMAQNDDIPSVIDAPRLRGLLTRVSWTGPPSPLLTDLFLETVITLYKMSFQHRFIWDLHGGNVMMRGSDTLVITDPFTG